MQRQRFRFFERLRVRWAEVDLQNIVFNGHYLTYWDTAISGYWRALGLPYAQAMTHLGGELLVRKATLEYLASAGYEDSLDVGMRCSSLGNSSITFECCVFRDAQALVSGDLVYVYVDAQGRKSTAVPAALRQLLQDYEAGQDLWSLAWTESAGLPSEAPESAQLIMTNRLGMTIGQLHCRRHRESTLLCAGPSCELTHLHVEPGARGQGMGAVLLAQAKQYAHTCGASTLWAYVPSYRLSWFTQYGFTPKKPEAGEDTAASVFVSCPLV